MALSIRQNSQDVGVMGGRAGHTVDEATQPELNAMEVAGSDATVSAGSNSPQVASSKTFPFAPRNFCARSPNHVSETATDTEGYAAPARSTHRSLESETRSLPADTQRSRASQEQEAQPRRSKEQIEEDDLFAKAQAAGLRMTRAEFEHRKASLAAFLKADRLPSAAFAGSSAPATNASHVDEAALLTGRGSPHLGRSVGTTAEGASCANSQPQSAEVVHSSSHKPRLVRPRSSNAISSPALAFYTAVVPSVEAKIERPRRTLDEVSNAEEHRRRRDKRRRLRARLESASKAQIASTTPDAGRPPLANINNLTTPSSRSRTQSVAPGSGASTDDKAEPLFSQSSTRKRPRGVGLGLQIDQPSSSPVASLAFSPTSITRSTSAPPLDSPARVFWGPINRRARVSPGGTLRIVTPSQELVDEVSANDDSGVLVDPFTVPSVEGTPAQLDLDISSATVSAARQEQIVGSLVVDRTRLLAPAKDRCTFLDQIMAVKTSPVRLRREAKARETALKLQALQHTRNLDSSVTHFSGPIVQKDRGTHGDTFGASVLADTYRDQHLNAADLTGVENPPSTLKSVRWADTSACNHHRMTTREHYDYMLHGLEPTTATPAASTDGGASAPWHGATGETPWRPASASASEPIQSDVQMLRVSASYNTSPLSARHHSGLVPASPDLLALDLQGAGGGECTPFAARRGLLFPESGSNTPSAAPGYPMSAAALAEVLAGGGSLSMSPELVDTFSHGPTLATSPAKGSESPETRARAHTLAAPFNTMQGPPSSPTAADACLSTHSIVRTRSDESPQSPAGARALSRHASSSATRRFPRGWAGGSPLRQCSTTVSPAALFGASNRPAGANQSRCTEPSTVESVAEKNVSESASTADGLVSNASTAQVTWNSTAECEELSASDMATLRELFAPERPVSAHNASGNTSPSYSEPSPCLNNHLALRAANQQVVSAGSSLASALGVPLPGSRARLSADTSAMIHALGPSQSPVGGRQDSSQPYHESPATDGGMGGTGLFAPRTSGSDSSSRPQRKTKPRVGRTSVVDAHAKVGRSIWDNEDGSRIVRLVSEELQQALDSGALQEAPKPRFYRLLPGWGTLKTRPSQVSYAGLIGQAILLSSDGKLSLNEIYNWISASYPYYVRGDRGWQNSIRHNLSLNKSFIKVERGPDLPGKGGFWSIQPGHESRFRCGLYFPNASDNEGAKSPARTSAQLDTQGMQAESGLEKPLLHMDVSPSALPEPSVMTSLPETASLQISSADLEGGWESTVPSAKHQRVGSENAPILARTSTARPASTSSIGRRKRAEPAEAHYSEMVNHHPYDADPIASGRWSAPQRRRRTKVREGSVPGDTPVSSGGPDIPWMGPSHRYNEASVSQASNASIVYAPTSSSWDTNTPARHGQPAFDVSSGHGSTHVSAVPMLTDSASSPPSSPILGMSGMIDLGKGGMHQHSAASDGAKAGMYKSTRDGRLSSNDLRGSQQIGDNAHDHLHYSVSQSQASAAGAYDLNSVFNYWTSIPAASPGQDSPQAAQQASPLASIGNRFKQPHSQMQFPGLHAQSSRYTGSPLRRSQRGYEMEIGSPPKLLSTESPVSSLRISGPKAGPASARRSTSPLADETESPNTAKGAATGAAEASGRPLTGLGTLRSSGSSTTSRGSFLVSPLRGSPLRPVGSAIGRVGPSPAGASLQFAIDSPEDDDSGDTSLVGDALSNLEMVTPSRPGLPTSAAGSSSGLHSSTLGGAMGTPNSTGLNRWLFTPGLRRFTPTQTPARGLGVQQSSLGGPTPISMSRTAGTTSDDPFDYGGDLTHALDVTMALPSTSMSPMSQSLGAQHSSGMLSSGLTDGLSPLRPFAYSNAAGLQQLQQDQQQRETQERQKHH